LFVCLLSGWCSNLALLSVGNKFKCQVLIKDKLYEIGPRLEHCPWTFPEALCTGDWGFISGSLSF
jgi:hypothetical protein